SDYPAGFPCEYQLAYRQEPRELVIEYRLPPAEVIPRARDFRYVKTRGEIDELPRPVKEIKDLYASVVYQVALRTMWECFAAPEGQGGCRARGSQGYAPANKRAARPPEKTPPGQRPRQQGHILRAGP